MTITSPPDRTTLSRALTANPARDRNWTCPSVALDVYDFHRSLPGYAPTPLVDLPGIARDLGVGHVLAKDESQRLGLPAFKGLGASWAIHRALSDRAGTAGAGDGPVRVVAATDGNHGRAVARFVRELGHRAHIFVPDGLHPAAVRAIREEGAAVTHVRAHYDKAVQTAVEYAARPPEGEQTVLVQDAAWEGYTEIPSRIVDGYSTLFAEIDDQLRSSGVAQPDLVVIPTGVGSLLQAALTHYRSDPARLSAVTLSVEPVTAACVQTSVAAGRPVPIKTGETRMAGLNCGTVSALAWPFIASGLDACAVVTDEQAIRAALGLADLGVPAGPCGGAALAAVRTVAAGADVERQQHGRELLGLSPTATVVLIITEGVAANPQLG